jgi:hypothetical protein
MRSHIETIGLHSIRAALYCALSLDRGVWANTSWREYRATINSTFTESCISQCDSRSDTGLISIAIKSLFEFEDIY